MSEKRPADFQIREVAHLDRDLRAAGFAAQLLDHRRRSIDTMHSDAALRERQRDTSSADAEFEHPAAFRERGEKVDCRGCVVAQCYR